MKAKKRIISALACLIAGVSHAGVLAAWDFNGEINNTASAGWTSFALADGTNSSVNFSGDGYAADGSLVLTQAATGSWTARDRVSSTSADNILAADVPLLAASTNEVADGFNLDGTQDFTLSGLEAGITYQLQFVGGMVSSTNDVVRNLTLTIDGSSANLFTNETHTYPHLTDLGGYSEYIWFTADGSDKTLTFGESISGNKVVGGLIVNTIEPPVVSPVVSAMGSDSEIELSWPMLGGVVSYDIKRSEVSGGPFTTIDTIAGTATSYTDTGLVNGTPYYYSITANYSGESKDSDEVSATPISIATGTILNEDFTGTEGYDAGNLAGQMTWVAANGSAPAFRVDPAGDGFADTEPLLADWDTTNGNYVGWAAGMENPANATWTGSVDFELNADAFPGRYLTNIVYDISGGVTNGVISNVVHEVGFSRNLNHVVYELGLTPDVDTLADNVMIRIKMSTDWNVSAHLNMSNTEKQLARILTADCGWDPNWNNMTNLVSSAPDFTSDTLRFTYTIQKTAAGGLFIASASFSNLVSGAVSGEEVVQTTEVQGAYDSSLLYFAMGKTEIADSSLSSSPDVVYSMTDIKLDAISLNQELSGIPMIPAPEWAGSILAFDSELKLSWEASPLTDVYKVYRTLYTGGPYDEVATVTNTTEYVDTGLDNIWTYYYVLTAVLDGDESAYSAEISGVPVKSSKVLTLTNDDGLLRTGTTVLKWGAKNYPTANGDASWLDYTLDPNAGTPWVGNKTQMRISYQGTPAIMKNCRIGYTNPQHIEYNIDAVAPAVASLSYIASIDMDMAADHIDLTSAPYSYSLLIEQESDVAGKTSRISAAVLQDGVWYCSVASASTAGEFTIENLGDPAATWQALDITVDETSMSLDGVPETTLVLDNVTAIGWYFENTRLTKINNLTVESVDSSATGYEKWLAEHIILEPSVDTDGDGMANLKEYAFGGDPNNADSLGTLPVSEAVELEGTGYFRYVYVMRKGDNLGIEYALETTLDLVNTPFSSSVDYAVLPLGDLNEDFNTVTNLIPLTENQTFIRLQINEN